MVSNNSFFNAVVRELYCPDFDYTTVTKYEIFKALPRESGGIIYYNTYIRLFSGTQIVCVLFYSYNQFTDEKSALESLVNGYHNNQFNTADNRQIGIKTIIDWDYSGFEKGKNYVGNITLTSACHSLQFNKTIALYLRNNGGNMFHPFYHIISASLVLRYDEQYANDWFLRVRDRKGIEHTSIIRNLNKGIQNTEFGILEVNSVPLSEVDELEICPMFDSADGGCDMYNYANIDLSKWRPTPDTGLLWKTGMVPNISEILENPEMEYTNIYRTENCIATWKALEPKRENYNLDIIMYAAKRADSNKSKFILTFMPSTLNPAGSANEVMVGNKKVSYHFPEWVYNEILNDSQKYSGALYIVESNNVYGKENSDVFVINWNNQAIRELYLDSCKKIIKCIRDATTDNNKPLLSYIDVVKIAIWGTWGEGVDYEAITGYDGNSGIIPPGKIVGPTGDNLITMSEVLIQNISNAATSVGSHVICLLPLMSYFNRTFPQSYRDFILSNKYNTGFFFDGVGANVAYWHEETAHSFEYDKKIMNDLYLAHKTRPIYLECATHVSTNRMPGYHNLVNFVKYFRCAYLNPTNIFLSSRDCKFNTVAMLKDISRYVGVKLAILSYDYEYINEEKGARIRLRFLNCGTSKIYHSTWRLYYYLMGQDGTPKAYVVSNYNLIDIPAAFEEDAPNWHDVAELVPQGSTTQNRNTEEVNFGVPIIKESDYLSISIQDTTGICAPMFLCNKQNYATRDTEGRYRLFTFK